jgi:hypothetical protein
VCEYDGIFQHHEGRKEGKQMFQIIARKETREHLGREIHRNGRKAGESKVVISSIQKQ